MDLVTLITVCAVHLDPKVMHALVWHQSGGEPWAVSRPTETVPRSYQRRAAALADARSASSEVPIRIGLAGLAIKPANVTPDMFEPCLNVTLVARAIARLVGECQASDRLKGDPLRCALAVFHGSWQRPDWGFADAVQVTAAKGDAPNFDMPDGVATADRDASPSPPRRDETADQPTRAREPGENHAGWESGLFPTQSIATGGIAISPSSAPGQAVQPPAPQSPTGRQAAIGPSRDTSSSRPAADGQRAPNQPSPVPPAANRSTADTLFVLRSNPRPSP